MSHKEYPQAVVGAYVFNKKGELFLMRSKKYKDKWGGPGGHIETGETMEKAVKREVKEETGLKINKVVLFDLKQMINSSEYKKSGHYISFRFYCRTNDKKVVLDKSEAYDYVWVKPQQAIKMNLLGPARESIKRLIKIKKDGLL